MRELPRLRVFVDRMVPAWPREPGKGGSTSGVVHPFVDALTRSYVTDAHLVQYEGDDGPRGADRFKGNTIDQGVFPRLVLHLLDVDDPIAHETKQPIAPDARAKLDAKIARLRADHAGVIAYNTRGGTRLLALLPAPVVISDENAIAAWKGLCAQRIAWLAREYDLVADEKCIDWTRLYRVPHGRRDGAMQRHGWHGDPAEVGVWPALDASPAGRARDLATLRALGSDADDLPQHLLRLDQLELEARAGSLADEITPGTASPPAPAPKRAPRSKPSRVVRAPVLSLEAIGGLGATIAQHILALPAGTGDRHNVRLAVVGALVNAGLPDAVISRVIEDAARATGTTAREWDLVGRRSRYERGLTMPGLATLRGSLGAAGMDLAAAVELEAAGHQPDDQGRPGVAIATVIEKVTGRTKAERWRYALDARRVPVELPADEITAAVAREITAAVATNGATVIRATTGAGKSRGATGPAVTVAQQGGRAAIIAPTHAVAAQLVAHLLAAGATVRTLHSPLAIREGDQPLCVVHAGGHGYARTGRSIAADLCRGEGYAVRDPDDARRLPVLRDEDTYADPCTWLASCRAYRTHADEVAALSIEGPAVLVTVHAYAGAAHNWIKLRPAGSPGLAVIDEDPAVLEGAVIDLATIEQTARRWTAKPYLAAKREQWRGAMLSAVAAIVRSDATDLAGLDTAQRAEWIAAIQPREGETRPRYSARPSRSIRRDAVRNRADTGALAALALTRTVSRAVLDADRARATVTTDWQGQRVLSVGTVDPGLADLLADPTIARVVLDATATPGWLDPWLPAAKTLDLRAADGAPVERIAIPWSHSNRRACLPGGEIRWTEIVGPLREGIALATEGLAPGTTVALFTWMTVATALRGPRAALPDGVREVLDALDARGITLAVGHYGATRGRDDWQHADALLALGTPWPDGSTMSALAGTARALKGWEGSPTELGLAAARAELDQILGRLRAPRRTRSARAVVLASVLPATADPRWAVRELVSGRPAAEIDGDGLAARIAAVGADAMARDLGVSRRTLFRRAAQARLELDPPAPSGSGGTPPGGGGGSAKIRYTPLVTVFGTVAGGVVPHCHAPPPPAAPSLCARAVGAGAGPPGSCEGAGTP